MKSKALKVYHLPVQREILQAFDAKPFFWLGFLMCISLLLIVEGHYFAYGLAIFLSSLFALIVLPKRILIEFSDKYMVVYHRVNKNDCMLVYYDDVLAYNIEKNYRFDLLTFILKDNTSITVPLFNYHKSKKVLNHFLPNKKQKKKTFL